MSRDLSKLDIEQLEFLAPLNRDAAEELAARTHNETMELIPAKQITNEQSVEEAVQSMGWDSLVQFVSETQTNPADMIGKWYMDMGDDCECPSVDPRILSTEMVPTVMICGMPSRVFFGIAHLYRDDDNKPFLNLKEVG